MVVNENNYFPTKRNFSGNNALQNRFVSSKKQYITCENSKLLVIYPASYFYQTIHLAEG